MHKVQNYVVNYLRSPNQLFPQNSNIVLRYHICTHFICLRETKKKKKNCIARKANFIVKIICATLAQFFFSVCSHFSHIPFLRVKLL